MAPSIISVSPDAAAKAAFISTSSLPLSTTRTMTNRGASVLPPPAAEQARYYAKAVCSWYYNTLDPYVPHSRNVECRLHHPLHVVTRRILYRGNDAELDKGEEEEEDEGDLETLFNNDDDDDVVTKDGELSTTTTRRSRARMEAFLASCAAAIREDHATTATTTTTTTNQTTTTTTGVDGTVMIGALRQGGSWTANTTSIRKGGKKPRSFLQIDLGDLLLRLEVYCRT